MQEYQEFFTLIGELDLEEKEGLSYFPLFRKPRSINFEELISVESEMQAVLLNAEEEPLLSVPLAYASYCTDPGTSHHLAIRGYIPFDAETRAIRYEYMGNVVKEMRVPSAQPQIEITTQLPNQLENETLELDWETDYEGDSPLEYKILYSSDGGQTWQRVGDRTTEQRMEIDVSTLPGGEDCRFSVHVTDGYNNARAEIDGFSVANKPVEVMILSPLNGESTVAGRSILLNGQAYDPNTGNQLDEDIVWISSIDGELGKGPLAQAQLSKGEHQITLQLGDAENSVFLVVD